MPTSQEYNEATGRFATWAAHMLHCSLWADAYDEAPETARKILPHAGSGQNWCDAGNHPPMPKATRRCALAWVKTISTECFNWLIGLDADIAECVIHDAVLGAMGHGCAFDDHHEAPDGLEWSAGSLEDCSYCGVIGPRGGLNWANAHLPEPKVPRKVLAVDGALPGTEVTVEQAFLMSSGQEEPQVFSERVVRVLPNRRHDWRLDRAAQQWVCKHCSAELPNNPDGRARALENRRCNEVDRRDVHDDLYRLHRSRGLLGGLIGAALAVGAAERRW